jgi:hypothetical protein
LTDEFGVPSDGGVDVIAQIGEAEVALRELIPDFQRFGSDLRAVRANRRQLRVDGGGDVDDAVDQLRDVAVKEVEIGARAGRDAVFGVVEAVGGDPVGLEGRARGV